MQKLGRVGLPGRAMTRVLCYFRVSRKTPPGYRARVPVIELEPHSRAFPLENVLVYVSDSSGGVGETLRPHQFEKVLGARRHARTLSHHAGLGLRAGISFMTAPMSPGGKRWWCRLP